MVRMLLLDARPIDDPEAAGLLEDYFAERAAGRPAAAGPYARPTPDPARFVAPEGTFLLARGEDGAAIGCGGVRRIPVVDGHPLGGSSWFEVKHVFVDPAHRGLGASRAIMAALERAARGLGADRLVLDTHTSQAPAIGLYRTLGYEAIEPYNENGNANRWFGLRLEA